MPHGFSEREEMDIRRVLETWPTLLRQIKTGTAITPSKDGHLHAELVIVQHVTAAPSHVAREGTLAWRSDTDDLYINSDGTTGWQLVGGGGGGAPTDADYLVGTANPNLSAEIVVGTTPGGELGGTWASPTVDTVHAGSRHAVELYIPFGHESRSFTP